MCLTGKEHVEVIRLEAEQIYSDVPALADLGSNAVCMCAIIMPRGLRPFKMFV